MSRPCRRPFPPGNSPPGPWMQEKAACISIDWPVRSCMMQRDAAATLPAMAHGQSTSPDPARFAKCPGHRKTGTIWDAALISLSALYVCVTYERKRGRLPFLRAGAGFHCWMLLGSYHDPKIGHSPAGLVMSERVCLWRFVLSCSLPVYPNEAQELANRASFRYY